MFTDLTQQEYTGRYLLATRIEDHIEEVDPRIIARAVEINIDLMAVSALDLITAPSEAARFRDVIYPLEIAVKVFPGIEYSMLETVYLDKPYHLEDCEMGRKLPITPKITAFRGLDQSYRFVFSVVLGDDDQKVIDIRRLWGFKG